MESFTTSQKRVSLCLKFIAFISAVLGTFLSAYAGRHSFMGGTTVYMYFTIQSNIALAIICAIEKKIVYDSGRGSASSRFVSSSSTASGVSTM